MFERYTQPSRLALFNARAVLTEHGGDRIEDAHLLLGLLQAAGDELLAGLAATRTTQGLAECLLASIVGPELLRGDVEVRFDDRTQRILADAVTIADGLGHRDITPKDTKRPTSDRDPPHPLGEHHTVRNPRSFREFRVFRGPQSRF